MHVYIKLSDEKRGHCTVIKTRSVCFNNILIKNVNMFSKSQEP